MNFNLDGRVHDLIATLTAGGVMAVAMSDIDLTIKIVAGALTSVFLLLGIIIRAQEIRTKSREKQDGKE